ncbi:hypothetical protein CEXT_30971 [Caerostris extrusa]|uniref:Uncharacterized protein n=1 Tax=Caerostris extrusa TaxID=172846 RepID=A0AAV4WM37_CAEEX|nr:hypothetical protein CEXT_30971 [Caerostris extrusa]
MLTHAFWTLAEAISRVIAQFVHPNPKTQAASPCAECNEYSEFAIYKNYKLRTRTGKARVRVQTISFVSLFSTGPEGGSFKTGTSKISFGKRAPQLSNRLLPTMPSQTSIYLVWFGSILVLECRTATPSHAAHSSWAIGPLIIANVQGRELISGVIFWCALTLREKEKNHRVSADDSVAFRRVPTDAIAKWDGFSARFIFFCTLSRSLVK